MRAHDDEAAGSGSAGESRPRLLERARDEATVRSAGARRWVSGPRATCRGSRPPGVWTWALLVAALGCSELTEPPPHLHPAAPPAAEDSPAPPPPAPETLPVSEQSPGLPQAGDQIEASHILVSYQGATRAKPTVTRTREEARALATQLAARARAPGTDFAELARDTSDGPSGVEGGALPRFRRQQMVKPFSDAAFALRPGEVSGVVETNFGFHIIKRTQ